jgi:transposase-like protein
MKKTKESIFQPGVEESLVKELMSGKSLPEVMAPLIKRILEAGLEGELNHHLLQERSEGDESNRRNGKATKRLRSEYGPIEISPSRDRNGTFEPELVGKRERQLGLGLERQILGLYGLGMSYEDIRRHLKELYGVSISDGQLHAVTEQVQSSLEEWRSRPLEPLYVIAWLDAIRYKVREQGRVVVKTVYFIIGVDLEGHKDVLGFYVGDHESAKFWLSVLTSLQQRGVRDILIACTDNLAGFAEAIESVFPDAEVQLCIVHQVRNSMKFIPYKDYRPFAADLKKIYHASTEEEALLRLGEAEEKWSGKYPHSLENWRRDWPRLTPMFQYGPEIRRLIYTTNMVEGLHRQLRKATKSKGAFTSEDALKKLLFLTLERIMEKWDKPVFAWNIIFSQLRIHFKERINPYLIA